MTIFKCKMCGGDLEITPGSTVCECEYCGTQQTLPKLDDDRRANMYDRANHFRRANEFDKAMSMYEKILEEDKTDSEAYWSIVLCRYGIEYVEDPATHKRVPTVNRAQFTSIFMDEDYKSALEYADAYQRTVYEHEAAVIDEIQKGILAISQNEEPFDVFICYKETGSDGRRTRDSVIATDLYHQLTQEGFKVFFSRITLEDKLGQEYEPYIFAALNSAKVMVVIGTKPEYFNAVWVRNEWSRYLMLIKSGAKKTLIPAYRDMDPYDLPEEFSHLQAQDMNKLGFMQDLIRGIKKISEADKETPVVNQTTVINNNAASGSIAPLLKRAFMFLEDGEWDSANEYAEKVLDLDPECAKAYVVKLLADRKLNTQAQLHFSKAINAEKLFTDPIENNQNYKKALRFADSDLKRELEKDAADNAEEYDRRRYEDAKAAMESAESENDYLEAAEMFEEISYYNDSQSFIQPCLDKAEYARVDVLYESYVKEFAAARSPRDYDELRSKFRTISEHRDAEMYLKKCDELQKAAKSRELYEKGLSAEKDTSSIDKQKEAVSLFERCSDYRDAAQKAEECRERIALLEQEVENARRAKEKAAKKKKTFTAVLGCAIVAVIAFVIVYNAVLVPMRNYKNAIALFDSGNYDEAATAFEALGDYKDAVEQIDRCHNEKRYKEAEVLLNDGKYSDAITAFKALGDYSDSVERFKECYYCLACSELEAKNYFDALTHFKAADSYKDAKDKLEETEQIIYDLGTKALEEKKYVDAIKWFEAISGYKDADEMIKKCNDIETKEVIDLFKNKKYSESFKRYKTTSFYNNNTSFEEFMNDNGLEKELTPFINDFKKYEGEYKKNDSYYPNVAVTINLKEMTFTCSGNFRMVREYSWTIEKSTYKKSNMWGNCEITFDTNNGVIHYKDLDNDHWNSTYEKVEEE